MVDSDVWQFHPRPQTKPIAMDKAIEGADTSGTPNFDDKYAKLYDRVPKGGNASHVIGKGFNNCIRPKNNVPCCTLPKMQTGRGFATIAHPIFKRGLSIGEAKRISSFPDEFMIAGNYSEQWAQIGNSVPPLLMKAIAENIRRAPFMSNIKTPTVISTFAGCGGSSLGYKLAGFKELLAVEWDDNAVETFRLNFPDVPVYHGDIAKLTGAECMKLAGVGSGELDVLDGSPPCQGFSTAGKRKFDDPRNSLFKEYARLVSELQPKVFVMENVTGMIKGAMKQAYLTIIKTLRDCGYRAKGEVLNAMYYNVPQSRERVIIVGVRKDLNIDPSHPKPQTKSACALCAIAGIQEVISNPYGPRNFNQARRYLRHHKPSPTLTKSEVPGSDLPFAGKTRIGLRGASRIASFPDSFQWVGKWTDGISLIGNSVPPNLMRAIAAHVKSEILAS